MKIGLVCPYTLTYGGVQEHVRYLYQNFTAWGHDVRIIAPRQGRENPQKDVIFLGRGFYTDNAGGTGSYLTMGFHYGPVVEEVLEREKFDLLHFHEPMVPTISWFLLTYSRTLNIMTCHNAQKFTKEEVSLQAFLKPFVPLFTKKLHGRIAVSGAALEFAEKRFGGEYAIIPNGVDLTCFRPPGKKLTSFQDGKINLLFVGRIEPRKGLIYLLRALSLLKDGRLRLIVVGDGFSRPECEKFSRQKKLDVSFEGYVTPEELPLYYKTADIFCSPAIHGESFGIVLLEAMASGCPVTAFANAGYKELLANYPTKKLLPKPKDVEGLAKALKTLVQEEKLRKALGLWGREEAQKYSWKKVARQVLNYYKRVLVQNRQRKDMIGINLGFDLERLPLPHLVKDFLSSGFIGPY